MGHHVLQKKCSVRQDQTTNVLGVQMKPEVGSDDDAFGPYGAAL